MQRAYFLGGASPDGFETAFWNEQAGCYGYCLKGGPGTGKSTLMKKIAAAFAGEQVSVYHCASDPHSLDAVVLEDRGVYLADTTAPHESSTPLPLVTGELVDLAAGLKPEKLQGAEDEIRALYAENKFLHAQVRKGLAGIGAMCDTAAAVGEASLNREKLSGFAVRFAKRILPHRTGQTGCILHRQSSAVTPQGCLTLLPEDYDWILLHDEAFAASGVLLQTLAEQAVQAGQCCEVTHALTRSSRPLTHVLLPAQHLAVIAENAVPAGSLKQPVTTVNLHRFYHAEALRGQRELLRFCVKTAASAEEKAIGLLAEALQVHDKLEAYYIRALHKPFLDKKAAELVKKILLRTA